MMFPFFQQGAFNIDANATPDQIAQKRAYIASLMPRFGSARYVGEGLGQLATGVAIGRQNRKLNEAEGAGRKSANEMFERLFGTAKSANSPEVRAPLSALGAAPQGQQATANPEAEPNAPWLLGNDAMAALGKDPIAAPTDGSFFISPETRAQHRPGGGYTNISMDFNASPGGGARGTEVIIPDDASPELRAAAERYNQMVAEFATAHGIADYPIRGVRTRSENGRGVANTVHVEPFFNDDLAMQEAIAKNPAVFAEIYREAFGSLPNMRLIAPHGVGADRGAASSVFGDETSYGELMANSLLGTPAPAGRAAAATAPVSAPSIPINELYMALQNPWLSPEQKGLITGLISEQQQASDPLRQLELRKAELELAQLENPTQRPPEAFSERMFMLNAMGIDPQSPEGQSYVLTGKLPEAAGAADVPASFAALDMQAQAAGLVPGTPEYQAFMRNGGGAGTPAAFTALDLQAKAAGFEPGTPEYQEFMATRGAGLAAEATTRGKAQAEAELAAPADISAAETTLSYITSLRDHPGRQAGSGASSWIGGIPGTDAREFQLEVERLKAGAFLTAIDQLKGMGALSNAEGQTATAAIAALDPNGTEEGFLKRLAEYEEIVNRGLERARKRAKAPEGEVAAGGKKRLKWNPATESFE